MLLLLLVGVVLAVDSIGRTVRREKGGGGGGGGGGGHNGFSPTYYYYHNCTSTRTARDQVGNKY